MKRGTAAKVILGKDTLMDVPSGIVHGTDVILGGKAGLLNDFGGLVLSNNLMLGKKVSRGTITTVTVRGQSPLVLPDAIAGSLQAVKAFGGTEQRNLPLGYTQFGRIHFDGHCYFNTGIVINSLTATVKLIAAFDSQTNSSPCMMWGYMGGNASLPRWGVGLYTDRWLTSANATLPYGSADTDKHIFIAELYDNSGTPYWGTYVDGALLGSAAIVSSEAITENTISTYIGARNNNGTAGNYVKGNFTYLEITQDGVCLAKIYPCKRDSDNVLGLYNTVTNEFLPNLGTGTLTADIFASPTPDVPMDIVSNNGVLEFQDSELPVGYRRVLGYACDNDVLWQITDFHLRGSDTVRMSFSVTAACNVFGCYQGTDATDNYDLYVSATSGSRYLRYGNGTYLSYWSSANMGQRFDVVFTPTGTSGMPQDSTWSPMTFESANDLLLATTTLIGTSAKLRGNLYGSFVVDGRLNLIPCERLSDSSLGYYDTYTGTFYEPTGTPTSLGYDFSYYSLKTSGPVETISVTGQNLIDLAACIDGYYYTSSGVYTPSTGMKMTDFIPVKANTSYTVYFAKGLSSANVRVNIFDSGKVWQSQQTMSVSGSAPENVLVITPDIDGYMRVSCLATGTSYGDWDTAQVVRGSYTVATMPEYEPYYDGNTATAEMLLSIDEYTDEQEMISGNITRKVGVLVLDGVTKDRKLTLTWNATYKRGNLTIPTIKQTSYLIADCACTHFPYATNTQGAPTSPGFCSRSQDKLLLFTFAGMSNINSSSDANAWLASQYNAGTPVIVIYPLETPTTESVAGQALQVTSGDNVVEITQASLDNLELEATYKSLVQLTIQEVEDANLNNNVEVTIS